jgi:hypothetical protein
MYILLTHFKKRFSNLYYTSYTSYTSYILFLLDPFQRIVIKIYYSIHSENLPGGPSGGFQEPSPMFSILFLLDPFQRIVIKIYYSIHPENLPGGPSGGFQEPSPHVLNNISS